MFRIVRRLSFTAFTALRAVVSSTVMPQIGSIAIVHVHSLPDFLSVVLPRRFSLFRPSALQSGRLLRAVARRGLVARSAALSLHADPSR
jgi:hypothetical protein